MQTLSKRSVCQLALSCCILLSTNMASHAFADVIHLKSGGTIRGIVLEKSTRGKVVVQSELGAKLTLSRRQIDKIVSQDDFDLEYAEKNRTLPDTADAHRKLAAWCKKNKQARLRKHHLQRLIELDPNDEAARLSLGYQQLRGRWMLQDEIMSARGLQKYTDGKHRTPQDIALRESQKKRKQVETDWFRDIRLWVGWLDGRRSAEAADLIRKVKDPLAANAIVKLLKKEKKQHVRDLLTATLAELQHPLAVTTLVHFSLYEPDIEVRLECLDYLMQNHQPVPLQPYFKALRSPTNVIVNRAAEALHHIEDPRAISPLIDALVTTHKSNNKNAPVGNSGASFSRGGGGGMSGGGVHKMGGGKKKIILVNRLNLSVLQALVTFSNGIDYKYNEKQWRMWFVNEQIHDYIDTRRDL